MAVPWIPYVARDFLDRILTPEMCVFEWGSGGSTVYFAERVAQVVTVEHECKEAQPSLENVVALYIPPEDGELGTDRSRPEHYYSEAYPGKNFKRYALAIDDFEPFDLVFVDGRARPSCLHHAKVKPGGWLVLDNSDREYYLKHVAFGGWEERCFFGCGPYNNYPWQITFWRKPDATSRRLGIGLRPDDGAGVGLFAASDCVAAL